MAKITLQYEIDETDLAVIALRLDEAKAVKAVTSQERADIIDNYITGIFVQAVGVEEEKELQDQYKQQVMALREEKKLLFKKRKDLKDVK